MLRDDHVSGQFHTTTPQASVYGSSEDCGPGWLHLFVLLFVYNAMNFTIMGPVSLVLLLRARFRDHAERRHEHRASRQSMVAA